MTVLLRSAQFRREREPAWRELDRLVTRVEKGGVTVLEASELARLPALYRAAVSSLSVARAISLDANLLQYLDALAARAYLVVYGVRRPWGEAAREFLREGFPRAVRALAGPVVLSALLTLLGGVAGFVLVERDSEAYYAIVPEGLAGDRSPTSTREDLLRTLYAEEDEGLEVFATYLFVHNTQVGMLAFALGIALGLPTLLLLLYNGLILGAIAQIHAARGLTVDLWGWLLPHGVPELTAVVLCGGAGLALARALVLPGERSRTVALVEAGRPAGTVVLGAALLLAVAGLIEGVFRQSVQDILARYLVAALGALLLGTWLAAPWLRRRTARRRP
jgi:uncharacterized membrane protein SpoIIM required for sporulation